jgi:hypothetical protein
MKKNIKMLFNKLTKLNPNHWITTLFYFIPSQHTNELKKFKFITLISFTTFILSIFFEILYFFTTNTPLYKYICSTLLITSYSLFMIGLLKFVFSSCLINLKTKRNKIF